MLILPFLLEAMALRDINKKKGTKSAVFFQGRFNPITAAHAIIIERMFAEYPEVEHVLFVVRGKETSKDKENNPLNFEEQKWLIKKCCPDQLKIIEVPDAFLGTLVSVLRDNDMEPLAFYAGSDRFPDYKNQYERYKDDLGLDELKLHEVQRTDESISSTKLRQAIRNDDYMGFKTMTKNLGRSEYNSLRKILA